MPNFVKDLTADLRTAMVAASPAYVDSDVLIPAEGNNGLTFRTKPTVAGTVQIYRYDITNDTITPEQAPVAVNPADAIPTDIQVFSYSMGPCFARFRPTAGGGSVEFSATVSQ